MTNGLTQDRVIEEARGELLAGVDWHLQRVHAGEARTLLAGMEHVPWVAEIPPNRRLWVVSFVSGELSSGVYMDAEDGTVYGVTTGIAN